MILNLLPPFLKSRLKNRPNLIKIIHNTGWLFFDHFFRMGLGLFVGVLVARYLGPSQYGMMNFGIAFISLFAAISTLGLEGIVVRDLVKTPGNLKEILGTSFVLQFLGGVLVFITSLIAIQFLKPNDPLARLVVIIIAFGSCFQPFRVFDYINQARVLSKYTVWAGNIAALITSSLKIFMIFTKANLLAFVWIITIDKILTSVLLVVYYIAQDKSFPVLKISLNRAKRLLEDSWPLILSGIMVMLYMRIDQVMLGKMIGDASVGVYSVAVRLTEIWYFIPVAVSNSVFPSIIATKQRDETLYINRLQKLYTLLTWMALSVAIIMTFASDWVINLLFGAEYTEAAGILSISIWAGIFVFQGVARSKWIIAENKQKFHVFLVGSGAIINVILNIYLIPIWGTYGAAFATLVSQFSVAIVVPFFIRPTRISACMLLKSFWPGKIIHILCNK